MTNILSQDSRVIIIYIKYSFQDSIRFSGGLMEGSSKKRVLHLAWEFPPYKVGGLGTHIDYLSRSEAKNNEFEVIVITPGFGEFKEYENHEGVHIYRFDANNIPSEDFPSWVLQMNEHMLKKGTEIMQSKRIDIIHAHDWLVTSCAVSLKHIFRVPLIGTLHSLELGRRTSIKNDREQLINDLEGRLAFESWYIIACSDFMKNSISSIFAVPQDKIFVLPNGIYERSVHEDRTGVKMKYALPDEEIILFMGRHVWEKGLDLLIDAIPDILRDNPQAKFVITGKGYMTDELKRRAQEYGVFHKILFTGFIPDEEIPRLLSVSSLLVVPSRYEPFGIVALEGMINKVPVVVSDVGGLGEIIEHEKTGMKHYVNDSKSLAFCCNKILKDKDLKENIIKNAFEVARKKYNWKDIARETIDIYDKIISDNKKNIVWRSRFFNKEGGL